MPFPSALVPDVEDEQTLLTYNGCTEAVSDMYNLTRALLSSM